MYWNNLGLGFLRQIGLESSLRRMRKVLEIWEREGLTWQTGRAAAAQVCLAVGQGQVRAGQGRGCTEPFPGSGAGTCVWDDSSRVPLGELALCKEGEGASQRGASLFGVCCPRKPNH